MHFSFFNSNTINGMEYTILCSWFDWLVKNQKAEVDLIGKSMCCDCECHLVTIIY